MNIPPEPVLKDLRGVLCDAGYSLSFSEPRPTRDGGESGTQARQFLETLFGELSPIDASACHQILGVSTFEALVEASLLEVSANRCRSRYQIIRVNDIWSFVDEPRIEYDRTSWPGTYISHTTIELLAAVTEFVNKGDDFLELGSGIGCLSVLARQKGATCTAIDASPEAAYLTALNSAFNNVHLEVILDDYFSHEFRGSFDMVVSNPPYRIVPAELSYPNPFARVGRGVDGLSDVKRILEKMPALLVAGGLLLVVVDVPLTAEGPLLDIDQLSCIFEVTERVLYEIDVDTQVVVSSTTCAKDNQHLSVDEISAAFTEKYASLGVTHLQHTHLLIRQRSSR